jgi:AbrB family looped-hinge helix DNA binding protein
MNMINTLGQAKITRGGQVTLSKKIREELGVDIGSYVLFQKDGNRLVLLPAELKPMTSG